MDREEDVIISRLEKGEVLRWEAVDHFDFLYRHRLAAVVSNSGRGAVVQYILLDLVCMRAAVYEDLVYPCVCKEFEGEFNERCICEREEALPVSVSE